MKKNHRVIIAAIFIILFSVGATFVFAEDDNEDDYRPAEIPAPVVTPVPIPVTVPTPIPTIGPVGIPSTRVINTPTTNENNLIDSDSDGIIDVLDMHPGEDDFAYAVKDINNNGIADDLEYLLLR